ncbi:RluA family pseudouridine synthase [Helicovermis profundi]|uniref:Pseudouridine synthase n=1 Tax=Helicovermis profundi TaxID=3065157 RepID=A0AAU9EWK7_9FIRM|nr:RluA family pseudouridine synthase [Clostridia bacterium S502]
MFDINNIIDQFEFIIDTENEGKRLDVFLTKILDGYSRNYIQKLIKDGYINVNSKVVTTKKYAIKENDTVEIFIPKPVNLDVEAEDIFVEIVYEDDDVIIVNKPQGMVVHPAPGNYSGTLVNALLFHAKSLSNINGVVRPGIVHRIDKDTSGLLMIAKNNKSHNSLAAQLKDHSSTRKYIAIVHGNIVEDQGTIDKPIARNPKNRLKMAVVEGGRESVTHYKVLKRYQTFTLVECQLETGRTHQIRVHMSYINHPLLGDNLYGPKNSKIKYSGQALHAKTLGFVHPTTNKYIEFNSELPEYFVELIKKIEAINKIRNKE